MKTETKTKCLKNPTCDIYAIFLYGRGFKDIKYHILSSQLVRFSLVNQNRADQDRTGQKRLQSRGPNFRTCVLAWTALQAAWTLGCPCVLPSCSNPSSPEFAPLSCKFLDPWCSPIFMLCTIIYSTIILPGKFYLAPQKRTTEAINQLSAKDSEESL